MANEKHPNPAPGAAPAGEKMVTAMVVSNYGSHRAGEQINIPEAEYLRLRESIRETVNEETGQQVHRGWRFPVLITAADQAVLDEQRRKEEIARRREYDDASAGEGGGPAWEELQRQSLDRLKATHAESQAKQFAGVIAAAQK